MSAEILHMASHRRATSRLVYDHLPSRPEPPPNPMLAAVAWWLAWSAESAQLAADNLHAMSKALWRPR